MDREKTLAQAIRYLISIKPGIKPDTMIDILYVADLHHYILYGRTIIENLKYDCYCLSIEEVNNSHVLVMNNPKDADLDMLSVSDKKSLDFAVLRNETDPNRLITNIRLLR